jgi:hypothetical protein
MKKIGFDIKNEFLPSFDKFQSNINQRLMFLKFFNQEVSCDMKFTKDELKDCKKETLFNIFAKKIIKNLQYDCYVYSPIKKVNVEKTNKVSSFINRLDSFGKKYTSFSLLNSLEEHNIDIAIKLINVLEECDFSFYLDGEIIFKNFVQNKILNSGQNREVTIHPDSIDIVSTEHLFYTKIYTFWQFLDSKNLKIEDHIKKAVACIENSEFKQVYLVYPKNENFDSIFFAFDAKSLK